MRQSLFSTVMRKSLLSIVMGLGLLSTAFAADIGIVNFSTCITDSKVGKKEQSNIEALRKQMASMMEDTESKLRDLTTKLNDSEYRDSLSPQAEEEMKINYQALEEDLQRHQQQFYQMMQGANYQLVQKMSHTIAAAAEKIAKQKKLDYVINKEACFYVRSDYDVTPLVIQEMDQTFEKEAKESKLSDNQTTVQGAQ
jgi:Skp family chaperone for outer membrane proteins